MRMADSLMNRNESQCGYLHISEKDSRVIQDLNKFQERQYSLKQKQELNYWVDLPSSFIDNLSKKERDELEEQHEAFTTSNTVALLQYYLTTKYPDNEDYVRQLCDPYLQDDNEAGQQPQKNRSTLSDRVKDKIKVLETKFKKQYDQNPSSIKTYFYKKNQAVIRKA